MFQPSAVRQGDLPGEAQPDPRAAGQAAHQRGWASHDGVGANLDPLGRRQVGEAALIAVSVACLGLFALSAYTAERRTKEIGVRKAKGASSSDILKLLL